MHVKALGIDPGTKNLGYSLLELKDGEFTIPAFGVVVASKDDFFDFTARLDAIGYQFLSILKALKPDYVVIEDFTEQGKFIGKTYKEMTALVEHLRVVANHARYDTTIYKNATWKKHTLNARSANKKQVIHYITHKIPCSGTVLAKKPDHIWDATALAYCKLIELGLIT